MRRFAAGQADNVFAAGAATVEAVMPERMRRVNELVQEVVADGIGELKDPRIGLVTITAVRISPDLREGTVYFSVFGSEKKKKASIDGLASARAVLQARLGRELRTKRTPHLTFEYDPTVEYGVRMTKLIDEIAPEAPASENQPDGDSH